MVQHTTGEQRACMAAFDVLHLVQDVEKRKALCMQAYRHILPSLSQEDRLHNTRA